MTEQTIAAQPEQAAAPTKPKQPRQLVRFTFYKLDPQWYMLPSETRQRGKQELIDIFSEYEQRSLMRSFALYGLRPDCDFILLHATYALHYFQGIRNPIRPIPLGP